MLAATVVEYSLDITDLQGNPMQSVEEGSNFLFNVRMQDVRNSPEGPFAGYGDLFYDSDHVSLTGEAQFTTPFLNAQEKGNTETSGVIDEFGAFSNSMSPIGGSEFLLVSFPMRANVGGTALFSMDMADNLPLHHTLVYNTGGTSLGLNADELEFGSVSLNITSPIRFMDNGDDGFSADGSDWVNWSQGGFQGDLHYSSKDNSTPTYAKYVYEGLPSGKYIAAATWTHNNNRATDVAYTISNSDGVQAVVYVNQHEPPNGVEAAGTDWTLLHSEVRVLQDGKGEIWVSNDANKTYVIADGVFLQRTGDISIAVDDAATTTSAESVTIAVLNNDEAAIGTTLTLTSVSAAGHGSVVQNQNGTVTYSPNAGYVGTDSFTYVATDSNGDTDTGEVVLTVTAPPPGSTAADDDVHTTMITSVTVAVLQNDSAAQGTTLSLGTVGPANNGLVVKNSDGTVTYTPNAGFTGTDQFTYLLVDSVGMTDTGTVIVTVTPLVNLRMQVTSLSGTVVTNVEIGEEFFVEILGQDQGPLAGRDAPGQGIFAFHTDVISDATKVSLVGSPIFGTDYPNAQVFDTQTAGLVDELGAMASSSDPLGSSERLLTRLRMKALAAGTANFSTDPADVLPQHPMVVYGWDPAVDQDKVIYGSTSVVVNEPAPYSALIDNGNDGFSATSGWLPWDSSGYDGDIHYITNGTGNETASYTATGVPTDKYIRVLAGWTVAGSRATNVKYSIYDDDQLLAVVVVDQNQAPNDEVINQIPMKLLGTYASSSGTLRVEVSDDANSKWVIADFVYFEEGGDITFAPEVKLVDANGTEIANNGAFNAGDIAKGATAQLTFSVKNVGTSDLTLGQIGSVPSGFSIVSNVDKSVVAPNGSAQFTIGVDTSEEATLSGTISFTTDDDDENPTSFTLTAAVVDEPYSARIDNGDDGFSATSGWLLWDKSGYDGDIHYITNGVGNEIASYTATGVPADKYIRVWANWTVAGSRATNVKYSIYDGDQLLAVVVVDQNQAPNDEVIRGVPMRLLGTYASSSGTLRVEVSDDANSKWIIADRVCFEEGDDILFAPEVKLVDANGTEIANNGAFNAGDIAKGATAQLTFSVKNVGTSDLTLGQIGSVPSGYSIVSNVDKSVVSLGESAQFTIGVDTSEVATLSGAISFTTNDDDENPTSFTLTAAVVDEPVAPYSALIDNGNDGFSATSGWLPWDKSGYGGDIHYITNGTGNEIASWTATEVPAGKNVRVLAGWTVSSSRATNVKYSIYDGDQLLAVVVVDQNQASNDEVINQVPMKLLGTYTSSSGTLRVELSDDANSKWVIADFVYFEEVPEAS